MIRTEQIVDSQTGHRIEVGTWNELWGFHCVTCDRWFAQRVYAGFDFMKVMRELVEQHLAVVTGLQMDLPLEGK